MSVTTIGKANFEKEVLQSDLPVMVDLPEPLVPMIPTVSPFLTLKDSWFSA